MTALLLLFCHSLPEWKTAIQQIYPYTAGQAYRALAAQKYRKRNAWYCETKEKQRVSSSPCSISVFLAGISRACISFVLKAAGRGYDYLQELSVICPVNCCQEILCICFLQNPMYIFYVIIFWNTGIRFVQAVVLFQREAV